MPISTQNLRETLRLSFTTNFSNRKIAELACTSINTVKKYRQTAVEQNLNWEFLKKVDDLQLEKNFHSKKSFSDDKRMPCWVSIHKQLQAKHQTLIQLWDEYCQLNPKDAYSYSQFTYYYRKFLSKIDITMRQVHYCPKLIERFKLGFANRTLGYHLPEKNRKAGKELRGQLQEIGILRQSGHEHFNGSLVVPVVDEAGGILEVYGRKILGSKLRKGTAQHLYLPGAHQGVWNAQGLKEQSQLTEPNKVVILCEALIDAMTFWRHGFTNVTSSYGTNGLTDEHLTLFKSFNIKTVLVAYDNDTAGNLAAQKLAEKLIPQGFELFRVEVPKSMDINSYACQVSPAHDVQGSTSAASAGRAGVVKSLSLILRQAKWMSVDGKKSDKTIVHAASLLTQLQEPPASAASQKKSVSENKNAPSKAAVKTNVSPVPEAPSLSIDAEITEQEINITLAERCYRVRGLEKNMGLEQLKINLLVKQKEAFHVDTLDLYSSKARFGFIKQAGVELGVNAQLIKADLGKLLLKLEDIQATQLEEALETKNTEVVISEEDKEVALSLLQDPNLLSRIVADFEVCGVVGERVNTLTGYLASLSRKLTRPLAVMIQSSSAAGKSSLMDAVLRFMPEEERVQYSAMTGQSLYYMSTTNLKHKILAISEEEGASNASYALKLLQSEAEISIATTGKNATTGNLETQEYRLEGPVMLFMTSTAIDLDEELMNRCLVLAVNESREQTQAIHNIQRQRRTLQGLVAGVEKETLTNLHQNAQRLLKSLAVVNPFADQLSFLDNQTRARRDHEKYLTLIDSIALLHQHQREIKTLQGIEYIEATLDDIAVANALAGEVLGRTLDELPPQTRALLKQIEQLVKKNSEQQQISASEVRFSRREIRDFTGWGNTQLKVHCQRLEEMEYLLISRGGRGIALVYELVWQGEGEQGDSFLLGLNNLENLGYDVKRSGQKALLSGLSRGQVGAKSVGCRSLKNQLKPNSSKVLEDIEKQTVDNALISTQKNQPSYSKMTAVVAKESLQ